MTIVNRCLQLCGVYSVWNFISFCKNKWNHYQQNDPMTVFLKNALELHQQGKLVQTDLFTDLLWILQKQNNKKNEKEDETENIMKNYIVGWYINQFVGSCSDNSEVVVSSIKK
jgi:hypothetical protein